MDLEVRASRIRRNKNPQRGGAEADRGKFLHPCFLLLCDNFGPNFLKRSEEKVKQKTALFLLRSF